MAMTLEQIEAEAEKLPTEDFYTLLERLHAMEKKRPVDPGIEAAWDTVISRRMDEIRKGTVESLDLDDVLKSLDDEFGLK